MTSDRKLAANRANARRSTGPRTAAGRARAARNATRHGLSLPILADPILGGEARALAEGLAEEGCPLDIALVVAESTLDLRRIRDHRHELVARALMAPLMEPAGSALAAMGETEIHILMEQGTLPGLDGAAAPLVELEKFFGPDRASEREARVFRDVEPELRRLDRYERRALSRRRSAIRRIDLRR